MGYFYVEVDGHNVSDYEYYGIAENHAKQIDGDVLVGEIKNHCTNCSHFVWWDGDYCCVNDMVILSPSDKKGNFICKIPDEVCENYEWNKGYGNGEMFYNKYFKQHKEE